MTNAPRTRLEVALAARYRIARELGAGGMATVYLAHDLKHDRDVAIKVLHPDLGAALGGERFLSEIRTTARLQHPHILPLLDSGDTGAERRETGDGRLETSGLLYYVMPLVTGETLRARLEREQQLPIGEAVRIAREVASALDYAHRQGVIHRDIKPENILLHDGQAIVADFGIALAVQQAGGQRMTQTGLSLGTPQYMSPEQAMGERAIDARSDIYSLAAVLYEMLTGDPPFTGSSVQAVVAKVMNASVERPTLIRKTVTPSLETAVLRALEKLPADRFGSAAEFAAALVQESTGVTPTTRVTAATRSPRGILLAGGVLTLLAGSAAGWFAHARTNSSLSVVATRPVRLTHAGQVGCAAIAPGGKHFALIVGTFSDETKCSGTLVVRPLPTGPDQVIARVQDAMYLQWSPAGDALVMSGRPVERPNGVWLFPTKGGAPRQLMTGRMDAAGFVDSAHVYAVLTADHAADISNLRARVRVLDAQSGATTDSTLLPAPLVFGAFASVSGRWFVFSSGASAQHYVVSRAGVVVDSMYADNATPFAWVGDSAIVYQWQPDWRPGDLMIRRVDAASGRFVGDANLLLASLPEVRCISVDAATGRVLWVTRAVTDELHLMSLPAPSSSRVLTRSLNAFLGNPTFSPDGRHVAYTRQDALGSNAYAMDLPDGTEVALSSDTLAMPNVSWPSAKHVLRHSVGGAMISFDVASGRTRSYSAPQREHFAAASANSWLFLRDDAVIPIWRDSLLQNPRAIPDPPGLSQPDGGALSADGRLMLQLGITADRRNAFAVYNMSTGAWSPVMPLDTINRRATNISSDGTVYLTRFNGHTEIWGTRVGGPLTLLATLPVQCFQGSVTVSDDGGRVLCNVTPSLPDAWMMELPKGRR
ncbi:MAG: serine/threonine-protein kinase [Gemmatimonas sp.]